MQNGTAGFDHCFLILLWGRALPGENLMQTWTSSPEKCGQEMWCTVSGCESLPLRNLKVLKGLEQGLLILVKDGRARIPKSRPIPNMAYSKSQVKTLQAEKEMVC